MSVSRVWQTSFLCSRLRPLQCVANFDPHLRICNAYNTRNHYSSGITNSDGRASDQQAIPLTGYYAELLQQPHHDAAPTVRVATINSPAEWLPTSVREETLAKARAVFGSRLANAEQRADEKRSASTLINGVLVPPKPEEPDNCCMSGCVNCVWDLYRDDMEEWAAKSAEARTYSRGIATDTPKSLQQPIGLASSAISMDDDGGGSETNWSNGPDDLFSSIPVGIREFMRTEKMLKQKHSQAQQSSAP